MTSSFGQRKRWLRPTAVVALTMGALLALVSGFALRAISGAPPALRFFDPRRSPTFDETCVVSTMDYALSSTERNDVIFIGDSACRTGVDPVRFEELTGLRAYNLGIVGDLPWIAILVTLHYIGSVSVLFHEPARRAAVAHDCILRTASAARVARRFVLADDRCPAVRRRRAGSRSALAGERNRLGLDGLGSAIARRPAPLYSILCTETAIVMLVLYFEWAFQQESPPVLYMSF